MTVATILEPNATVAAADSLTGAATDWEALSDTSAATYTTMTALGGSGLASVGLSSFTLPAGAVTKSLTVTARLRSGTVDMEGIAFVSVHSEVSQDQIELVRMSAFAPYETGYFSFTSADSSVSLTQAAIDNLEVRYQARGEEADIDFSRFFVTVTYVAQPVVAVDAVSPDPWTASTRPTITWVDTLDSDGGAQTRYWVKVFDEATYGVGFSGLDPDTDTPYYDSGNLFGSNLSHKVGVLENGDTYRAYVKVAQRVSGESVWSAWDYDEFDISVTTSDVDTVTTVASNSSAKITVTVARDTGTAAWDYVEVQRKLTGGSWTDVRFATYVDATGSADSFVVDDYETPNGVTAIYRARATRIVTDQAITGSWVQSTPAVSWTGTDTWLKVPVTPASNTTAVFRTNTNLERPARRGVFNILGSAAPVVISDTRSAPQTQIVLRVTTLAAATAVTDLFDTYDVVLIQTPTDQLFGSQYVSVGSVTTIPVLDQKVSPYHWIELADVVEVDLPADSTAGDNA